MENNIFKKYTDEATYNRIVDFESVAQMWQNSVSQYPNNLAVATAHEQLSYAQLDNQVARFRTVLAQANVQRGSRVGIYLPNGIDFVKAFLAVTTLGATAVLLPPHLDNMSVFGCSMKYGLCALIFDDSLSANTQLLCQKNPSCALINQAASCDTLTQGVEVSGEERCTVIFTGGTTGKSKGSILSNRAVMRGTKNGCYGYRDVFEQRYLLVLPLTHVFGLIRNLLTALYTGSTLFICQSNQNMFRDIAAFRPTILVLVPALAQMALNLSKKFNRNMLGDSLKYIICGAAFVPPYLINEYAKLNITLFPGYGLTESANLVSGNAECQKYPDSVGFIYPGIETKIVNGELWLKGVNMQEGYMGEDEDNAQAYEDGWFKTGDLVRIDENGLLYITGRIKELIVLPSGENVSPAELESVFSTIDAISDCLVYESDKGKLELEVLLRESVIKAQAIANPEQWVKDEVARLNANLPTYMKISRVVFRTEDFVRTPSMKINRKLNGNVKN